MLWGCFGTTGTDTLHKVDGTMKTEDNLHVFNLHLNNQTVKT